MDNFVLIKAEKLQGENIDENLTLSRVLSVMLLKNCWIYTGYYLAYHTVYTITIHRNSMEKKKMHQMKQCC